MPCAASTSLVTCTSLGSGNCVIDPLAVQYQRDRAFWDIPDRLTIIRQHLVPADPVIQADRCLSHETGRLVTKAPNRPIGQSPQLNDAAATHTIASMLGRLLRCRRWCSFICDSSIGGP